MRVQLPLFELPCKYGLGLLGVGEIEPEKLRVMKGADSLILIGDADGHPARRCGKCRSLLYRTPEWMAPIVYKAKGKPWQYYVDLTRQLWARWRSSRDVAALRSEQEPWWPRFVERARGVTEAQPRPRSATPE